MLDSSEPVNGDTNTTDDLMSAHPVSMSVNVQFARILLQYAIMALGTDYNSGWANFL